MAEETMSPAEADEFFRIYHGNPFMFADFKDRVGGAVCDAIDWIYMKLEEPMTKPTTGRAFVESMEQTKRARYLSKLVKALEGERNDGFDYMLEQREEDGGSDGDMYSLVQDSEGNLTVMGPAHRSSPVAQGQSASSKVRKSKSYSVFPPAR